MKKFSELKENEEIFINEFGISESQKIIMIEKTENCILIDTESELIFIEKEDFEKEICVYFDRMIPKTIATSMDKILLELEEN